nr:meiotic recombination protein SPO11-2 [Ipomoea batatas]
MISRFISSHFEPFQKEPNQEFVDCSTCGSSGYAISGDLSLLEKLVMKSDARYIIVVEKVSSSSDEQAIFQHSNSGFGGLVFTALLALLHLKQQVLICIFQNDFFRNPAGLAILCTFKYGSIGMGLEAFRYACNVKWLGLRKDDIEKLVPEESLVPLKQRDVQIAKSLISSEILQDNYKEELAVMVESDRRAEIEALYFHGYDFLGKFIANKIVQMDYI